MSRKQRGFTLIELMIVIAIIAIIAAIAIPNLLAARLSANETAAIATLRNITSAQAQFQQSAKADTDNGGVGDGTGEYGGFIELSGSGVAGAPVARLAAPLVPPVLSGAFRVLTVDGEVSRSGYFFRMYLPTIAGAPVPEPQTGFTAALLNADLAETTWCCYSWPVNYNQSGNRTFFTNQAGDVLGCEVATYSGPVTGGIGFPTGDAAFVVAGAITGNVDITGPGQNPGGALWRQVN